jgi:hypothetical protein
VAMQRDLSEAALLDKSKYSKQPRYLPTPEEIRAACDEIQAEKRKRRELMGEHEYDGTWEPPSVYVRGKNVADRRRLDNY